MKQTKKFILIALVAWSLGGCASNVSVAVKRGQAKIDPACLPLVCLSVATNQANIPLDAIVFENTSSGEKIRAVLSKSFDAKHPDMPTAIQGGTRSLSLPILHFAPGTYLIASLEFMGPATRTGYASIEFPISNQKHFTFEVKPGCVNYIGGLIFSADWRDIHFPYISDHEIHPTSKESSFPYKVEVDQTALRDANWAHDVIPGMKELPAEYAMMHSS